MDETPLKEALKEALSGLNRSSGVYASAIVSRDGLLIASMMPEDVDAETFAAMTATMTGAAETAFSELKKGITERVIVEGTQAKIITTGAGEKALLVAMSDSKATLGLILLEMKKAVEKIKKFWVHRLEVAFLDVLKDKDELVNFYKKLLEKITAEPPIVDKDGKIIRFGERCVLMSSRYWPASLIEVVRGLGPVIKTFLYNFGYRCGRDAVKRYLSLGIPKEEIVNYVFAGCWYLGRF
ncbi:MAG: hypothetical protein DRO36_01105 [Candidatus Hecatellales archaeon]|nr:MAG: hypothetical protein DRO36_01105 [Candidatus Hecatellales archaeon]